ncbi:hypothetical protein [Mycobacterium sp. 236(2023)]|uniref:hypothetical protein n=1 Tax=Mycobacterium sp. 236(2023) TaxID=3038163 RepID=UPI002415401C|nr:hypothetical protein [Mycobacterium sp. 236(2023)]MDG4667995.1 hypothetical protein [Mycobacterium sp. 236(2023)]
MPVPEEHIAEWKGFALNARTSQLALQRNIDPLPGSALAFADAHYPWEKVSAWSRDYLLAAADFLVSWADQFAPYKFEPDAVNTIAYRPYLMFARCGLEAAAHGLWLLAAGSATDCVRRHVRLMHRDFEYHRSALEAGNLDQSIIQGRIDDLVNRSTATDSSLRPMDRPPGYEKLVRLAAENLDQDVDRWAYLWNAASGAAHGQNWFGIEAFELMSKQEYEPGYFRVKRLPDVGFITETLDAAVTTLAGGTHLWLRNAGVSGSVWVQAMRDVFSRMPKRSDGPPAGT